MAYLEIEYRKSGMTERAENYEEAKEIIRKMFPQAITGGLIFVDSAKDHKVVATVTEIFKA